MIEKAKVGFVYTLELVGVDGEVKWREEVKNLIPDAGRDYILTAALLAGSQVGSWHIGLYGNGRTPLPGDTMATLLADAGELTTYTTDPAGIRLPLTPGPLASGVFSNNSDRAEFIFPSGATARGGFITSSSLQGGTTGVLLSAVLFPTPKIIGAGETLKVVAGLVLATA